MSDRDVILGRVQQALRDVPADEPASWQEPPAVEAMPSLKELADLFAERCDDYRATVTRCDDAPGAIAKRIAAACRRHKVKSLVVPTGLDPDWLPAKVAVSGDEPPLTPAELSRLDGVLTGSALAIAETGTIALDAGSGQGRRALTLVPDLHICVVRAEHIVPGVPEAMAGLADAIAVGQPITFISGPSATSDIELRRVEGVHGPRRLEVIVAG